MAATKGLTDHLFMAVCEWFLMFWMFIHAALSYYLSKFAQYCDLQIPCLLCSRIDHFFGNEEPGSCFDLFCNKHQVDISCMIYCNLHNELVDIREMCEDCFNSVTLQGQSTLECFGFVLGREREVHQRSYLNKNFVCMQSGVKACCCCERKSNGEGLIKHDVIGSRGSSKVTAKPPLPRIARHGRSRQEDGLKGMSNKVKHRRRSSVGYSDFKFNSDSELEFLCSEDDDDGSFYVMGIGEGRLNDDSIVRGSTNGENQYKHLGMHSYSTPDLGTALILEAHLNEISRTRSTSLTPGCSLRKTKGRGPLKAKKHKKPSSTNARTCFSTSSLDKPNRRGSLDGSCNSGNHNRYNGFSRHSYSASDLGSALLLDMHLNSLPQRSASLTPSSLTRNGLGELKCSKDQTRHTSHSVEPSSLDNFQFHIQKGPQKAMKHRKSSSSTHSIRRPGSSTNVRSDISTYYLDKTSDCRHSDDSVVSRNMGSHHRHKIPRRHSYSVFQMGCEILLNMPHDESLTDCSASFPQNGYVGHGFEEPNKSIFHLQKDEKVKEPLPPMIPVNRYHSSADVASDFSTTYTNKIKGHGSLDDSVISCSTGNQHQNSIPRRHSYSFFELGCEILLNMPDDEGLMSRSVSLAQNGSVGYGLGEPKTSKHQTRPSRNNKRDTKSSPHMTNRHGSLDDSVLSRNMASNNKNKNPRRHSYSAFELGCALLLEMHMDEFLTHNQSSLVPNGAIVHGLGENNPKIQTRPCSSHSREHNSLNTTQFSRHKDFSYLNKTKKHGSSDDSVVSHRIVHQNQNKIPRRHSYSAFDLDRTLFMDMLLDDSLKSLHTSFAQNHATRHGLEELNQPQLSEPGSLNVGQFHHRKVRRDRKPLPLPNSIKGLGPSSLDDSVVSRNKSSHNHNKIPRRHSYSVLQLGGDILLNMPSDESLASHFVSLAPNDSSGHSFGESQKPKFQTKPSPSHSQETSSSNAMQSHSQKSGKDKNPIPPISSVKRFSSSSDARSDSSSEFLDDTKWRGSLDDLVVSRSMGSHNQNEVPRRHSYSAFDLGRALLVEMHIDESLKRCYASTTPSGSTGHSLGEHNQPHSSESNSLNRKANRDKNLSLPNTVNRLGSSSGVRSHGHQTLDDSVVSHSMGCHNHNTNPRRHSYSAFELGCTLLLDMQRDRSSTRRSASLTPSLINYGSEELMNSKMHNKHSNSRSLNHRKAEENHRQSLPPTHPVKGLGSSTNVRSESYSTCFYKPHRHGAFDDSIVSHGRDSRKRYRNLPRNSYSVSDLTSHFILERNLDESLTSKSASLTPNCSIGEGLGELNRVKFQIGPISSHSPESGYLDDMEPVLKRKKVDYSKAKESNKTIPSTNNVYVTNSRSELSNVSLDKANQYGFFDDSVGSNDMGSQNRFKIFARNSQSATDLGSALLEMHLDDSVRSRSKSLTPNCSGEHGLTEEKWLKSQIKSSHSHPTERSSFIDVQFPIEKTKGHGHLELEKDKKPILSMNPTKEMDSLTNIRSDLCPTCLDKIDVRSFDGSSVFSEMEVDGCIEKVKRQAEDDVRCMRLLQSELEAERNAATVAANHAMNMITKLQQEKASLQMEALQYLRMMEEQAEYDMEALQKANELVEEKENEIQDLLDELDQYRIKYGDLSTRNVHVPITNLEEEKGYILESLSKLEKKLHQLSSLQISNNTSNGVAPATNEVKNNEKLQSDDSNDGNSLSRHKDSSISNGVHENHIDYGKKTISDDGIEADLATMEHEISQMKTKMEALQTEVDLLKHACNTLHGNDGLEFIQEIAHQLQDLRRIMFDIRF